MPNHRFDMRVFCAKFTTAARANVEARSFTVVAPNGFILKESAYAAMHLTHRENHARIESHPRRRDSDHGSLSLE